MTLEELQHRSRAVPLLREGGLDAEAAARQAGAFTAAAAALRRRGGSGTACAFFVPGRVEVLGKHTDYAGGRSLVCALERGFCVVGVPDGGPLLRILDVISGEEVSFPTEEAPAAEGHWSTYPRTVARRMARDFPGAVRGGTLAFASDLPQAAGLSSSSAFVVATFLALSAFSDLPTHPAYRAHLRSREALAQYLGAVESGQPFAAFAGGRGVGTFGGSEDHTAILCAVPGALRRYAYAPTRFEGEVPLPERYVFAVASSGVLAQKTGAARDRYNRAARLAARAAEAWRAATGREDPHLGAALAAPEFSRDRMCAALRAGASPAFPLARLSERFAHFYAEDHLLLPAAAAALHRGDLVRFGVLVDRSQRLAERFLKNQVPETVFLAREARRLGAAAASAFGAGFGGSVWALVPEERTASFLPSWSDRYAAAFPEPSARAAFFAGRPGPPAFRL